MNDGLRVNVREGFHSWISEAKNLGFVDFVSAEDGFNTNIETGHKWQNANATGIYFWIADDGEAYVGKATRVKSRLLAHWKNHPDLAYASFQLVHPDNLDLIEQKIIRRVGEVGYRTRNIKHALETNTKVPFDQFMSAEHRHEFLSNTKSVISSDVIQDWREMPVLEQKQSKKFSRFLNDPQADEIISTLNIYINRTLPYAAQTEARFWSVSLYPQNHILRLNVGHQEVLTIGRDDRNRLQVRVLTRRKFGWWPQAPAYQSRSYVTVIPAPKLDRWLTGKRLLASRDLAIWLMRHTTTLNSGSHCPQIVRTPSL